MARSIALSVLEGRTVRDLFYTGLLERLGEAGSEVTIFTEAVNVPRFVDEWRQPHIRFAALTPAVETPARTRAYVMRRRLVRVAPRLARPYARLEQRWAHGRRADYVDTLRNFDVFVATHAHLWGEAELIASARAAGVPTIGLVRSWDNVYKGIKSRPDRLLVWNEINRQELMSQEAYRARDVEIVGAPQFDPYFAPDTVWLREKFAAYFDLDPERPIILFASVGWFHPAFDETYWMDALLDVLDQGEVPGRPQVICRLHPWSRYEHFRRYESHPDVRLSFVDRYLPTLTWYMTLDDIVVVGNMLAHADVVITPASTVTLEAAIFDRPTVVPTFHEYQPSRAAWFFSTHVMGKHFGRIVDLDLVPIVRERAGFGPAIARCLADPGWYREKRQRLVSDYVPFTDGRSIDRIVDTILRTADQGSDR